MLTSLPHERVKRCEKKKCSPAIRAEADNLEGLFYFAPFELAILERLFSALEVRPCLKTNIYHFRINLVHLLHVPILVVDVSVATPPAYQIAHCRFPFALQDAALSSSIELTEPRFIQLLPAVGALICIKREDKTGKLGKAHRMATDGRWVRSELSLPSRATRNAV